MTFEQLEKMSQGLNELLKESVLKAESLKNAISDLAIDASHGMMTDPLIMMLSIFVLAIFVGYYVVWHVTPALHSPLMAVTNAISSVIIVGGIIAAGAASGAASIFGLLAVFLASINIFGGFVVTERMLAMFKAKK